MDSEITLEMPQATPNLIPLEQAQDANGAPNAGTWTPEVMRVLLEGIYGILASRRGPHWAWNETEGGPLIEPTAEVFNMTPGLRNLAPQHVAILTVVMGHGTMIAKRLSWDAQIAAMKKQESRTEPENKNTQETQDPIERLYGKNKLEG
ncbi:hypothetical protein [Sulfobacillus thermosulfidooxidans]|uniref:hypothetical protein n=1 Tax=Sulfobacillus thermosulfidooxidans TaxID=28034 RepID=UPI0002F00B6F|nr:hypothetical protein [Sulfobacillus thermosulfidooxidans]